MPVVLSQSQGGGASSPPSPKEIRYGELTTYAATTPRESAMAAAAPTELRYGEFTELSGVSGRISTGSTGTAYSTGGAPIEAYGMSPPSGKTSGGELTRTSSGRIPGGAITREIPTYTGTTAFPTSVAYEEAATIYSDIAHQDASNSVASPN